MKHNKLFLLLLPLLLMTSCGGGDDSNSINFMVYQPSRTEDQNAFKSLIASFTQETGIKVNLSMAPKDKYDATFKSALKYGNDKPDLAYLDQPTMAKYASDNPGIIAIDDLVASSTTIKLDKFNQSVLDTNYINGKLYGLPLNMTASVLFYNKDLVSEEDLPSTWEQWLALGDKVPSDKALFSGIGAEGYAGWYFQGFLKNCGGELFDYNTNKCTFNTPQGRETAQFIKDLYRNETDHSIRDATNSFVNGDVFFKIGSSFDVDNIRKQNPEFETKLGAILLPNKSGDTHYSVMGGENLVITSSCKKHDSVMKLIEFLLKQESSTLLSGFTGNFPAITEYATTTDPVKQVILNQLNSVVARPKVKNWTQVNDNYLGAALDSILDWQNPADIATALQNAEDGANQIL